MLGEMLHLTTIETCDPNGQAPLWPYLEKPVVSENWNEQIGMNFWEV